MAKPLVYQTTSTDPCRNIATERVLMDAVGPGECILYLWQNRNTIVIGRNQNAWKECRVAEFEKDGGRIVRRLSGGGAVFHDMGNLNFTFIAHKQDYDFSRQMKVLCDAVRSFGLEAEFTGRNDILIDGAKFSGNAFLTIKDVRYHHGTLMIKVDKEKLARYLNPDAKKIASKGVASVKSRVVNLQDLCPEITVDSLGQALIASFEREYGDGLAAQIIHDDYFDAAARDAYEEKLSSWEWIFGHTVEFTHAFSERFAWGDLDARLVVDDGKINSVRIYSDALDADLILRIASSWEGLCYDAAALEEALDSIQSGSESQDYMLRDVKELVQAQFN
ncbi:MAG: lipoate--protein ligase [Eggerthellaceae bacterium]